jgi:hypothetical protein
MPRSKSIPASTRARRTTKVANAPKLPHERDQSNDTAPVVDRKMRQAHSDLRKGLVDTDLRGAGSQALARRMRNK